MLKFLQHEERTLIAGNNNGRVVSKKRKEETGKTTRKLNRKRIGLCVVR